MSKLFSSRPEVFYATYISWIHFMKSGISIIQLFIPALLLVLTFTGSLSAETVFLKNGEIIEGDIIQDSAGSITLRQKNKTLSVIYRADVLRILYTKINMGKIYVQKRDGKGMEVYMVDEDQNTCTFRRELNKADEFILKRSEILFISETNPSGLEGAAESDMIKLKWLPPYNRATEYTVYIKSSEGGKYEPVGKTDNAEITLKNLDKMTTYWITVTATGKDGYESLPSNELKISTRSIRPDTPVINYAEKEKSEGAAKEAFKFSWSESADPDGRVVAYRIYGVMNGKKVRIGETSSREYTLTDYDAYSRIELAAIDNNADESKPVKVFGQLRLFDDDEEGVEKSDGSQRNSAYTLLIAPAIIMPLGDFNDMGNTGVGGLLSFTFRGVISENILAGFETGYYYVPGTDTIESSGQNIHRFNIVTAGLKLGYVLHPLEHIIIKPAVTAGETYIGMTYLSRNQFTGVETEKSKSGFDFTVIAGFSIEYIFNGDMVIGTFGSFGTLFEKSGSLLFVCAGLSCGMRF